MATLWDTVSIGPGLHKAGTGLVIGQLCADKSPNAQMLFKPQPVSCLLIFHWSKQVTWQVLHQRGDWLQGHGYRRVYFIGGPYYNNIPYLGYGSASNTFSRVPVLSTSCSFYTTTARQSFLNTNYSVILGINGSHSMVILFPMIHLATSGNSVVITVWKEGDATSI